MEDEGISEAKKVFTNTLLREISMNPPTNVAELSALKGVKAAQANKWGYQLTNISRRHASNKGTEPTKRKVTLSLSLFELSDVIICYRCCCSRNVSVGEFEACHKEEHNQESGEQD